MRKLIILLYVIFSLISCTESPKDISGKDISAEYWELLQENQLVKLENYSSRYYININGSIKEIIDVSNTTMYSLTLEQGFLIIGLVFISGIIFTIAVFKEE